MERIRLRETTHDDLDFVFALEREPENAAFVGQWSREEHAAAIARPDREHWIIERLPGAEREGFLIAYDLVARGFGAYLKRIVVAGKSRGLGARRWLASSGTRGTTWARRTCGSTSRPTTRARNAPTRRSASGCSSSRNAQGWRARRPAAISPSAGS